MHKNIYKDIRTELGFTQKELGELLGIDTTQISRAENGHATPALYEYALKGLRAETATESVDVEPFKARIAELEAELEAAKNPQPSPLHPAPEQPVKAPTPEPLQPKKRSGLGRRSNAPEFKND